MVARSVTAAARFRRKDARVPLYLQADPTCGVGAGGGEACQRQN
jgi:hypothetical protein